MSGEGAWLRIEPVVSRPHTARAGGTYLVTVDLRGPAEPDVWPYDEEEFAFGIALDGGPQLVCEAIGHPGVVLHRFGDTYGPARFVVTAGPRSGTAVLRLSVSNSFGVPVRTVGLPVEVLPAAADDRPGEEVPQVEVRLPAPRPAPPPEPEAAPEPAPEPEAEPVAEPVPEASAGRLTVSYVAYNRAWANWIVDRLERRGVPVVAQRWDIAPGDTVEQGLRDLLLPGGRVLLVLSDWYFQLGPRSSEEWDAALRAVLPEHGDRFTAVTTEPVRMPAAASALGPAELGDLGAAEAERLLLVRCGIDPEDRTADAESAPSDGPRFPLDPPAVAGAVPRRNPRFTGRHSLLGTLHSRLAEAPSGAGICALIGLSGVGKTHIATEYVHRFAAEYDVVWWVRADERGVLRERLAGLASALGLVTGREYGERLRAVREALRRGEPYARWLVVLDGADHPEDVHDLVPSGPGHVLITSQNRDWAEHNTVLVEVPVYDREESVAFVRRRAPRLDDADADKLADALGDLALALDQNAGALHDSTMPVDEYIGLLGRGTDVESGLKVAADFQMTYFTAFSILLNRLRAEMPSAVVLLRLCVFFAPGPVPVRLLRDLPADGVPAEVAALALDPLLWDAAIGKLAQWSVIQSDPRDADDAADEAPGGADAVQMHRLVYQAVRAGMPEEEWHTYSRVVCRLLAGADPGRPADPRRWPRYAEIVPHLEASRALESPDADVRLTVINCLRYLHLAGEYRAGLRIAEFAAGHWPGLLGPGHSGVWDLVHNQANMLRGLGDYAASEALDRDAYSRLRADRGDDDLLVLRAASSLAADLRNLGRYDEALELAEFVQRRYTDRVGGGDFRTLTAQKNTAVTYRLLGRYADALDLDLRTLETRRELLGPRSNSTLSSESSYAHDLRLLGRYDQAASVQEHNCELHRTVLGPDNPQSLRAEHNFAECLYRLGDRPRAADLTARLLERCQRALGDTHPLTMRVAVTYSSLEREHGDLDRARERCEFALRHYREQFGDGHPFTAGVLTNHALLLRAAGEPGYGRTESEKALVAMTAAVGEDHPWTLGCALNATAARNFGGDPESAAELSRDTGERAAHRLGARHPLTLSCRIALAADLRGLRGHRAADSIETEALTALTATLGARHPHTAAARARTRPFWDFEPFSS